MAEQEWNRQIVAGYDAETMVLGAKKYAAAVLDAGTDRRFVMTPARWLAARAWENEDEPAVRDVWDWSGEAL